MSFRARIAGGERVLGLFVKSTDTVAVEVLAGTRLGAIVLDVEHAPFGRDHISAAILAARVRGRPVLVRLPSVDPAGIQQAVALGADGLMLPHVNDAGTARDAVVFARTLAVERAVAGMHRAAEFGRAEFAGCLEAIRSELAVVVQVDEPEGVAAIDEIAAVQGIDAIFIGRLGLTFRLASVDPLRPDVAAAMTRVAEACRRAGRSLGLYLTDPNEARAWAEAGASFFVIGVDTALLAEAADARAASFDDAICGKKP